MLWKLDNLPHKRTKNLYFLLYKQVPNFGFLGGRQKGKIEQHAGKIESQVLC